MKYSNQQILKISEITSNFYKTINESFSSTRQYNWSGWEKIFSFIEQIMFNNDIPKILDFACGNLRFENYLMEDFPDKNFKVTAIDNCDDLVFNSDYYRDTISFRNVDIINSLVNDSLNLNHDSFDLVVCFGLFHHIPSYELRIQLLKNLLSSVREDGFLICSFWQFEKSKRIFKKAIETTTLAMKKFNISNLEDNDYFLSWKDNKEVFRFCHNFNDDEINKLIKDINAEIVSLFNEDGGEDKLNKYLVLKK